MRRRMGIEVIQVIRVIQVNRIIQVMGQPLLTRVASQVLLMLVFFILLPSNVTLAEEADSSSSEEIDNSSSEEVGSSELDNMGNSIPAEQSRLTFKEEYADRYDPILEQLFNVNSPETDAISSKSEQLQLFAEYGEGRHTVNDHRTTRAESGGSSSALRNITFMATVLCMLLLSVILRFVLKRGST